MLNEDVMKSRGNDGTVGKALEILDQIATFERPVRFAEVLSVSPHPKATLYRLLQTLTNQGMLNFDVQQQTYAPGLRLVRLAHAAWRQSSLALIARNHIDALSAQVGETIHLAQLDQGQVLYLDKRNARTPVEMFSQAGKIGPGYCTGVGKVMIAHLHGSAREDAIRRQAYVPHTSQTLASAEALRNALPAIRAAGVAFDREEHEPGIICIAAPILSPDGRLMGAISITSSTRQQTLDGLDAFRTPLLDAAANIAASARNWQFPA